MSATSTWAWRTGTGAQARVCVRVRVCVRMRVCVCACACTCAWACACVCVCVCVYACVRVRVRVCVHASFIRCVYFGAIGSRGNRGRLAVLHTIMGKPMGAICNEMKESHSPFHVGDVKYHLGLVRAPYVCVCVYARRMYMCVCVCAHAILCSLLLCCLLCGSRLSSPHALSFCWLAAPPPSSPGLFCAQHSKASLRTIAAAASAWIWRISPLTGFTRFKASTCTCVQTQGTCAAHTPQQLPCV